METIEVHVVHGVHGAHNVHVILNNFCTSHIHIDYYITTKDASRNTPFMMAMTQAWVTNDPGPKDLCRIATGSNIPIARIGRSWQL